MPSTIGYLPSTRCVPPCTTKAMKESKELEFPVHNDRFPGDIRISLAFLRSGVDCARIWISWHEITVSGSARGVVNFPGGKLRTAWFEAAVVLIMTSAPSGLILWVFYRSLFAVAQPEKTPRFPWNTLCYCESFILCQFLISHQSRWW